MDDSPSSRLAALLSPGFLAALGLLLLNDFVLKQAFPGPVTGKLSDFAGLFAFAVFWSTLLPRFRPHVAVATAVGFALWKSPLAQPVIDAWNALPGFDVARVVDFTDLLALAVLPLAYRYRPSAPRMRSARVLGPAAALVAVFAFGATSMMGPEQRFELDDEYRFSVAPAELVQAVLDGAEDDLERWRDPANPVYIANPQPVDGAVHVLSVITNYRCYVRVQVVIAPAGDGASVMRRLLGEHLCPGTGQAARNEVRDIIEEVLIEPLGGVRVQP